MLQVQPNITHHLDPLDVSHLCELRIDYPEPDFNIIDRHIALVKKITVALEQIQQFSSEEDKLFESLCSAAVKAVESIDQHIEFIKSLPEYISWKQKAYDKLEHLVVQVEDLAETLALATNEGFIRTLKSEIFDLIDESASD